MIVNDVRILVTGGLGFIGSNFIRHTLSNYNDLKIINIDKMSYGSNPANLKEIEKDSRYEFVKGDITDKKLMRKLVEQVDVVVNFAAESFVDRSIADPWSFFKSNVEGVLTILEAIRHHNSVRFIQISTDEVYGDITNGSFTEEDKLAPSNPYASSKAAAEMFCLSYGRTYGLEIIITRCTNNFGPLQFPEKLIPKTIIRALKNLPIPVYGTGENIRDWLYVLDHCEAISLILDQGKAGEIYNISSGNELSNITIVKQILKLLDKQEDLITFVADRPGHDLRYSLDSSKIRRELGWKPKYDFWSALKETVNWYVENESWWKPMASEKILNPTPWKTQ